ncbi:MAG: hypothetical protein COB02_13520 [Candidatus Cloacimonadota bacterium]|nr:MAG: hypothetical protein COB02_13520 [Candidatus Cloacimonadota bacterium]
MFKNILSLLSFLLCISIAFSQALQSDKMVFLVKVGQDSQGDPMYQVADSSNPRHRSLYDRFYADNAVQRVITAHQKAEQIKKRKDTPVGFHANLKTTPVFIELGNKTGTFNDWKSTFSIRDQQGRNHKYDQPRVVIDMNDSMFNSKDTSLVEQTLVHEIGHGIMRQAYGKDSLPDTPWLGRSHYGDLVTDEQLGLIEGWAEFVGAYYTGRHTIAEDPAESLSQNAYAYQDNGQPKSPEDLMKTEGWVATVLLHIANHNTINNGFDKLVDAMSDGAASNFNQILRNFAAKNPEDAKALSDILKKDSIDQFSQPLGGALLVEVQENPPAITVATYDAGIASSDSDLMNMFNDYQSSLNTYSQLKLDIANVEWYYGAHYQEIQKRLGFQQSLVKNLEAKLLERLKNGGDSQEKIANMLLNNLSKIRFNHNRALQSYQKMNFWNRVARNKLKSELELYQELYKMNKFMADSMDQPTLIAAHEQRVNRMRFRVDQANQSSIAAAPSSSKVRCNANLQQDCYDSYNKLINAISRNQKTDKSVNLLKSFK